MTSKPTGRDRGRRHVPGPDDPLRYLTAYMIGLGHGPRWRRQVANGTREPTEYGATAAMPYSAAFLARLFAYYVEAPETFHELWSGDEYWTPHISDADLGARIHKLSLTGRGEPVTALTDTLQRRTNEYLSFDESSPEVVRNRYYYLSYLGAAVFHAHCLPTSKTLLPNLLNDTLELCRRAGEEQFYWDHLAIIIMARIGGPRLPWDKALLLPPPPDLAP